MSLLQAGFGSSGEYTIDDSLRFRSSAGAYLSRTNAANGNLKTFTFSCWIKYSYLGGGDIWSSGNTSGGGDAISFRNSDNKLNFALSGVNILATNAVYRDPSAWYHIVLAFDTSQATASNRIKLYVNGEQITSFLTASYPSLNTDAVYFNTTTIQYLAEGYSSSLDCYLTEVNFIDGQQLTADDFGEFDDNGTWKPLAYTGTYGTNGFYLNGVGVTDESGNGNDWTNNNLNLSTSTATTYDQMKDTPSLVDENAGNFATLNPLDNNGVALTEANLTGVIATNENVSATIAPTSGKWYWEVYIVDSTNPYIGVKKTESNITGYSGDAVGINTAGDIYFNASDQGKDGLPNFSNGDVVGVGLDVDAQKIWWSKNGQWYTADAATESPIDSSVVVAGTNGYSYGSQITNVKPYVGSSSTTGSVTVNFGQRPFAYTPPSGFLKLNTFNLPDSTIEKGSDYFNTVLYTGNGSTQSITGVGFQPDWTWIKNRDAADAHVLTDAVRGATEELQSNATSAETTNADGLTAFDTDGFSLGADVLYNTSSEAYVAWNWLASNTTASNTVGSITSTVSVNTTSGFSIVSYTGTGANATVGHGLGVAPSMMIVKGRDSAGSWAVYHANANASPASGRLYLQLTNAFTAQATAWNSTVPSSTVFSVGSLTDTNQNTNAMIAYCFAEVPGYSAFGSYTGNGSTDGPFVYTGMRPSFLLWKRTNSTGNWTMMDSTRNTYNVLGERLYANLSNAGSDGTIIDFVSNGFKLRVNANDQNGSGSTYIYMAFAETHLRILMRGNYVLLRK
jgi:hypothetical protein